MNTDALGNFSRSELEEAGFAGFVPLLTLDPTLVPREHGVYAVLRTSTDAPQYLVESLAGRRINHTVTIEDLTSGWLD
ncbi:hypothetical protein [Demequina sp.]|uniref:hypothetical protein n=1 Tax=Demequina sp. TaxID=2050685 RepID=UPI0025F2407A|nr:hypothetical protein [Demequina sp.]